MSEPTAKDPRGPTNLRIKFRSASLDQFIERYAADVSRGGIFIRTREPLAVNTRLRLEFQLQDATPLLAGEGTVVWIREHDQTRENVTPGMGVRFDKLAPECQPTLEKILAEKTRLEQAGVAAAGQAKSGGMAVRRPSGVFASLDANARAVLGTPPVPGTSQATGPEATPIAVPPAPAVPAAPSGLPKAGAPGLRSGVPTLPTSSTPSGPFGRVRATGTHRVPVPSALFEPPTAADIDKALEVLQEAPGPAPGARATPSVPRYVADDASNEPTRVGDVVEEMLGGNRPATPGAAPMTERLAGADDGAPTGDTQENPVAASEAAPASLDGPIEIQDVDVEPAVPEPQAQVQAPVPAEPSKRFRAASKAYPTLNARRRGMTTGLLIAVVVLAAAAGAALKLHLKDRFFPRAPAPGSIAAPAPAAAPETAPANANAPAPTTGGAPAAAAQPAAEKPAEPSKAEEKTPEEKKPEEKKPEEKKPETAAAEPEAHGAKHHPRRHAEADSEAKAPSTAAAPAAAAPAAADKPAPAEKPAPDKPAPDKPAEKPAAEQPAAAAAPSEKPAPAAPSPILKVTSSPSGAVVLIDGKEVGTTPFSGKDVDPASPHTITIKKDGYETSERMVSGLDWSRPHGNSPQALKVNAKLRRSAAAPAAAAPKDDGEQKPNEPEDTGGPYIKEVKPDSP